MFSFENNTAVIMVFVITTYNLDVAVSLSKLLNKPSSCLWFGTQRRSCELGHHFLDDPLVQISSKLRRFHWKYAFDNVLSAKSRPSYSGRSVLIGSRPTLLDADFFSKTRNPARVTSSLFSWRLKSPTSWLFVQHLIWLTTNIVKASRHYWPFVGWSTGHKGPVMRKAFPFDDVIHAVVIKWNIFRVTGTLWGESTGHQWIPLTKASDTELWCLFDVHMNKRLSKQSRYWSFEMPWRSLWRHCNGRVIITSSLCFSFGKKKQCSMLAVILTVITIILLIVAIVLIVVLVHETKKSMYDMHGILRGQINFKL